MINLLLKVLHWFIKSVNNNLGNVFTIIPISIIDQDPSYKKSETNYKSRGVLTYYQIVIVCDPIKGYEEKYHFSTNL